VFFGCLLPIFEAWLWLDLFQIVILTICPRVSSVTHLSIIKQTKSTK